MKKLLLILCFLLGYTSAVAQDTYTVNGETLQLKTEIDGQLDLSTAFWGYGFFGSIVVGVVCGFLAEAFSPFFILVYAIAMVVIIIGLWQCASTYKKQMAQKKASELWGILTQAYCVLTALGLANFIKDFL